VATTPGGQAADRARPYDGVEASQATEYMAAQNANSGPESYKLASKVGSEPSGNHL